VTAADYYQNLTAYVDFLTAQVAKSGIANMFYHYGDWVPPPPYPRANESLTSAGSYDIDVMNVARMAGLLGNLADHLKYTSLYTQIGMDFHKAFYVPAQNTYVGNTLTANVFAMAIDAVPPSLQDTIMNNIISIIRKAANSSTCGILGWKYLLPVLSDNGYHDVALQIASKTTYPSMGYMFTNPHENATTLWELLDAPFEGPGMNSRNHIMWGSIGAWFYRYIGGIKPNRLGHIEIAPAPVGPDSPVTQARVKYDSIKGEIVSNWKKTKTSFEFDVSVPSSITARVVVPKHESAYSSLTLHGETIANFVDLEYAESTPGIDNIRLLKDGSIEMNVQPGKYSFFASI